ncbi:hypothetical protein PR048_004486 [Dryococelus australis]|uniref:Uncharacterized protein n=1 Tax=Dryococelus australis TaxID=614101 RepID=A0ABQ9I5K2_9NEOP|nr:hypothetical protein PR048_004486 [Dryococelus australis]
MTLNICRRTIHLFSRSFVLAKYIGLSMLTFGQQLRNENYDVRHTTFHIAKMLPLLRKPMRVIEASMKQRRNERAGETGDPRENPPTNCTIPTCENPVTRPGSVPGSPWWEAQPPRPPSRSSGEKAGVGFDLSSRDSELDNLSGPQVAQNALRPEGYVTFSNSFLCMQEWPDYLPPNKSNRVRFPARSQVRIVPDDAAGRRVFSGKSCFPPPLHSDNAPYSPRFTFIGSQDLDVKSRPNFSTPLFAVIRLQVDAQRSDSFFKVRPIITRRPSQIMKNGAQRWGSNGIQGRPDRNKYPQIYVLRRSWWKLEGASWLGGVGEGFYGRAASTGAPTESAISEMEHGIRVNVGYMRRRRMNKLYLILSLRGLSAGELSYQALADCRTPSRHVAGQRRHFAGVCGCDWRYKRLFQLCILKYSVAEYHAFGQCHIDGNREAVACHCHPYRKSQYPSSPESRDVLPGNFHARPKLPSVIADTHQRPAHARVRLMVALALIVVYPVEGDHIYFNPFLIDEFIVSEWITRPMSSGEHEDVRLLCAAVSTPQVVRRYPPSTSLAPRNVVRSSGRALGIGQRSRHTALDTSPLLRGSSSTFVNNQWRKKISRRASQKQSSDTHTTPYDKVKLCRERKINITVSERVSVDCGVNNKAAGIFMIWKKRAELSTIRRTRQSSIRPSVIRQCFRPSVESDSQQSTVRQSFCTRKFQQCHQKSVALRPSKVRVYEIFDGWTGRKKVALRLVEDHTVSRVDLSSRRPLRRPLLPEHRRALVIFCRERAAWKLADWLRVVFSDKSQFCCCDPRFIAERRTAPTRGVIVWGVISYEPRTLLAVIEGTVMARRYVQEISATVCAPFLMQLDNPLFQKDNAMPHTARVSRACLRDVDMLVWSASYRTAKTCGVASVRQNLPQKNLRRLDASMPDDITACVRATGFQHHTKCILKVFFPCNKCLVWSNMLRLLVYILPCTVPLPTYVPRRKQLQAEHASKIASPVRNLDHVLRSTQYSIRRNGHIQRFAQPISEWILQHRRNRRYFTSVYLRVLWPIATKIEVDMNAVSLLASHQGDPGSIPVRVTPYFRMWKSCRTIRVTSNEHDSANVEVANQQRLRSQITSTLQNENLSTELQFIRSICKAWHVDIDPHTRHQNDVISQQHVRTVSANQHFVTYWPASTPANSVYSAVRGSQSYTRPVLEPSHNQSENEYSNIKIPFGYICRVLLRGDIVSEYLEYIDGTTAVTRTPASVTSENVGMPCANQRLVTYSPASSPANSYTLQTYVPTNMRIRTVQWLSAVTVESDDWANLLQKKFKTRFDLKSETMPRIDNNGNFSCVQWRVAAGASNPRACPRKLNAFRPLTSEQQGTHYTRPVTLFAQPLRLFYRLYASLGRATQVVGQWLKSHEPTTSWSSVCGSKTTRILQVPSDVVAACTDGKLRCRGRLTGVAAVPGRTHDDGEGRVSTAAGHWPLGAGPRRGVATPRATAHRRAAGSTAQVHSASFPSPLFFQPLGNSSAPNDRGVWSAATVWQAGIPVVYCTHSPQAPHLRYTVKVNYSPFTVSSAFLNQTFEKSPHV